MVILQKPGEIPQKPGEYIECDSNGNIVPGARQVTMEPGDEPLPPTQKKGLMWKKL
jgi:hypothetical protein